MLILVGAIVAVIVLGSLTKAVKNITKGAESLTKVLERANAKMDAKAENRRAK